MSSTSFHKHIYLVKDLDPIKWGSGRLSNATSNAYENIVFVEINKANKFVYKYEFTIVTRSNSKKCPLSARKSYRK